MYSSLNNGRRSRRTTLKARGPLPPLRRAGLPLLLLAVLLGAPGTAAVRAGERAPGDVGRKTAPPTEGRFERWEVGSVRVEEDRLILDDQSFVVTPRSRCHDEKGRRVALRKLPSAGIFTVRFVTRPRDEEHPEGARTKVLLELQVLQPPTQRRGNP